MKPFKKVKKIIKKLYKYLLVRRTVEHLKAIREKELELVLKYLPKEGCLLEIGAGSGWQAAKLSQHGYVVSAIDVPDSNYRSVREYCVQDYDGKNIPFSNEEFDIVFSSNVLEHIKHVLIFQNEIKRVLKNGGVALHVVPSSSWRFWTTLTHFIRYWSLDIPHGEHASNVWEEYRLFGCKSWFGIFKNSEWEILGVYKNRLFYTGNSILDHYFNIKLRILLSYLLGSACNIYVLKKI